MKNYNEFSSDLMDLKNEIISHIMDCETSEEIEHVRIKFLGKNGKLTQFIKNIKDLNVDDKKESGMLLNEIKKVIEEELSNKIESLGNLKSQFFDLSIPGIKQETGSLHIITQAIEEISEVFEKIGFVRSRYPEVEWDWYAFESLNFDSLHPARDDWETFFVDSKPHSKFGPMILTPHTSSGQVREMQRVRKSMTTGKQAPIRMINIAKCYRRQSDISHVPMFHQFEGLVIDEGISIVHLRGTLDYFARTFFGSDRKTRIRPYNFPFTEPSFEVDINCDICKGLGKTSNGEKCKLCKEGWLEIGGAGMVHPNVLKAGGIDHKKYTGFAFGWGVERVFMMKSGLSIPDIRMIYSTDLRYLNQF